MLPVFRQILTRAEAGPGKPALVSGDRSLSYAGLASRVVSCAERLRQQHGVMPGDRVLLVAAANPEFVCTYLAVHSIAAVCVPVDPHTGEDRVRDVARRVAPKLTISDMPLPAVHSEQLRFDNLAALDDRAAAMTADPPSLGDSADILFTTGTTGQAKGVILSHRALAAATAHINAFVGTGADAVEVLPLPLGHSFGLGRLRCVLSAGATLVLVPGFVHPAGVINALTLHNASGFASVPTGIAILLSKEASALGSFAEQLDYIEIGSSAMPTEQKKRLMELLPTTRICMHYGLTEASRSAFLSFHDDREKLDSIGRPSRGVAMRVVDESGDEVPPATEGEIEVRGDHLMSGYWDDADLTRSSMHGGWLRTGDLGRRDEDGFFYLGARAREIINVGGRKIAPQEIEQVLLRHPAIADCACLGIPDPQGIAGQIISVYLVAEPGLDALPRFPELAKLLRQSLEPYKMPRQFHWVDGIPKSASGKVLRQQLRDTS